MEQFNVYPWIFPLCMILVRIGVGIYGKPWLNDIPNLNESEHYSQERSNNLTLAGFALAAITLFMTYNGNSEFQIAINDKVETLFYLSISLVSFITASYFFTYTTSRYYSFIGDTLEWLGLFTVGIALLVFFDHLFFDFIQFQIVYLAFFCTIIFMLSRESLTIIKHVKNIRKYGRVKEE